MNRWIIIVCISLMGVVFAPGIESAEKQDPYKAFIVTEASTGNILEGENIHLKWPPASITKLMLVDIVMEKLERGELKLSDNIVVSGQCVEDGGQPGLS